jgi:hypothetical protein
MFRETGNRDLSLAARMSSELRGEDL